MIFRYKIEIISDIEQKIRKLLVNIAVAPFVGVWIEICSICVRVGSSGSLPSWECGLKLLLPLPLPVLCIVAPFVGVWIEIPVILSRSTLEYVAPFVGVWIEICHINAKVIKIYSEYNSYPTPCIQYIY